MNEQAVIPNRKIQDESIVIREAKPDFEEGLVFAQFFNEASEGFFQSMLGIKTNEIIASAFVKPNNEYSFENVAMIEYKGKIAGMVSGYSYTEQIGFNKKILFQSPKGAKLRIIMFSVVGSILMRFLGPHQKEDYYLQGIAVSSQMRGKGLGQRLMHYSSEIALKKGCKTLLLDVSTKNEKAIKSYHKFGMKKVSHWPDFLKLPSVFTKMAKEL